MEFTSTVQNNFGKWQFKSQSVVRQFIFSMSRRSKVASESLFLRGVAIKPPILNSSWTGAEDGRVVTLYFTKLP